MMLDGKQQEQALNLVRQIELGNVEVMDRLLDVLEEDKIGGIMLVIFLMKYNKVTRNAIKTLYEYKRHKKDIGFLEKCYLLSAFIAMCTIADTICGVY